MRNNDVSPRGGAKKFLYSGPKKTEEEEDDFQWNFNKNSSPRSTSQVNGTKGGLDVDEVWNIRRNVNIGAPHKASDSLAFNVNKNYYSRHGGNKDKEEFGGPAGNTNSNADTNQGSGGKSWNMSTGQSRRPFSYSFGLDPNQAEKPVSPRNTSNSSFANYPPIGNVNNNAGSVSSRESVGTLSKEPMSSMNFNYGTMSSREPKTSQFLGGAHTNTNNKNGQSFNSFPSSGNTNNSFGQSKTTQSQVYSSSVFNGSIFSKNNAPW